MTPLTHAITEALVQFLWQGCLVALGLRIALAALRRSRPEARYAVACVALLALAILPVVTAWRLYSPHVARIPHVAISDAAASVDTLVLPGILAQSVSQSLVFEWAFTAWLLGVSVFTLRFFWGARQLAVLRRTGSTADEQTVRFITRLADRMQVRRFQVLFSSLTDVPSVIGWIRPVVLLPAATLAGLTPSQLEAVIAHELAHIRRHDYAVNILQMVIETFLFYHPAVWWTSQHIRTERELCCDDLAVRTCGDRLDYARALAAIEKVRTLKPGFAVGSADGPLLFRIRRLVTPDANPPAPSRLAGALVLLPLSLVLLAAGAHALRAQAPAPEVTPATNAPEAAIIEPVLRAALPSPLSRAARPLQQAPAAPATPPSPQTPQTTAPQPGNGQDAWFLHRDGRFFSNHVSAEQADALRRMYTGDFLWFRQGTTAYVTNDRAVLDRMATLYTSQLPQNDQELAAYLQTLAAYRSQSSASASITAQLAEIQSAVKQAEQLSSRGLLPMRELEQLRMRQAMMAAQLDAVQAQRNELRSEQSRAPELNTLQARLVELQAQVRQIQAEIGRRQNEQIRLQESIRLLNDRMKEVLTQVEQFESAAEVLKDAVKSGAAKPVQ